MTASIHAELLKLRTTRTFPVLIGGAAVLVAAIGAIAALTATAADGDPARTALAAPGVVQAVALVLGVLAVTTDIRHGTITPALLVDPDCRRLVLAKLIAVTTIGLLLGLATYGLAAASIPTVLDARGIGTSLDGGDIVGVVVGGALGTGLFAAIGVGFGALIGNQVGAVTGALGWLYVVEQTLGFVPGVGEAVRQFGLAGLSSGLATTAGPDPGIELLAQLPAGLLLVGYATVVIAAGTVALARRDITT